MRVAVLAAAVLAAAVPAAAVLGSGIEAVDAVVNTSGRGNLASAAAGG